MPTDIDIGFYADSGGTTKLKWEVEKYDGTTGNLIAWVKIPIRVEYDRHVILSVLWGPIDHDRPI